VTTRRLLCHPEAKKIDIARQASLRNPSTLIAPQIMELVNATTTAIPYATKDICQEKSHKCIVGNTSKEAKFFFNNWQSRQLIIAIALSLRLQSEQGMK